MMISYLFLFYLYRVASSPKCSMDYNCLSIVFGPPIVGLSNTCLNDLKVKSTMVFKVSNVSLKILVFFMSMKI